MIQEFNFQYKVHTQTAWIVGKVGQTDIPPEPARIEDFVFAKRAGIDTLAYRVQYQNGRIGYVFVDEIDKFKILSFRELVNDKHLISSL